MQNPLANIDWRFLLKSEMIGAFCDLWCDLKFEKGEKNSYSYKLTCQKADSNPGRSVCKSVLYSYFTIYTTKTDK